MTEFMRSEDNLTITAPDFSFTITREAVIEVSHYLYASKLTADTPDLLAEAQIFGWLTLAEGYSDETAKSLINNDYYHIAIHSMWEAYKVWRQFGD